MPYEKHYNRNSEKRYNKGDGKSSISLKPIIILACIIVAALLVYQFRERLSELFTKERKTEQRQEAVAATPPSLPDKQGQEKQPEAEQPTTIEAAPVATPSPNTEASTTESPNVVKEKAPTNTQAAQPKAVDRSRHRIECFRSANGKYGFVDKTTGETFIAAEYDSKSIFKQYGSKQYAIVNKGGKLGIIDANDKTIAPFSYSRIELCTKNTSYFIACITDETSDNELYGLMRVSDGKMVIPSIYKYMSIMETTKFIVVQKGELYGAINERGEEVIPITYKEFAGSTDVVGFRNRIGEPYKYYTRSGVPTSK